MVNSKLSQYLNTPVDQLKNESEFIAAADKELNRRYKVNSIGKGKVLNPRAPLMSFNDGLNQAVSEDLGIKNPNDYAKDAVNHLGFRNVIVTDKYPHNVAKAPDDLEELNAAAITSNYPEYLARQRLPKYLYMSPKAQAPYMGSIHELGHMKDNMNALEHFKEYDGDELTDDSIFEDLIKKPPDLLDFLKGKVFPELDYQATHNSILKDHMSPEAIDTIIKYPFNRIKGKLNNGKE